MKERSNRVIGYQRVSTEEQAASGLGMADQRSVIEGEAARRGWTDLTFLADDGFSAKNLARPGISRALNLLSAGEASTLVVSKLDRLSRSILDFVSLMERARREGWQLVVLDLAVDTSTPSGSLMANVLASFAEYERRLISARTSAALQAKKAQGARLGRPRAVPAEVASRILSARRAGATLRAIAEALNDDGVPTVNGGRSWYASTVAGVLRSHDLDAEAALANA
jgi:DNA invertase Pin-like site-specific DNA recombinase